MEDGEVSAINKEDITRYEATESKEQSVMHDSLADYLETPDQDWLDQKMNEVAKLRHVDRDRAREVIGEIRSELEQAKALQERGAHLQDKLITFIMNHPDSSKEDILSQFSGDDISRFEEERITHLYGELHARREASQRVIEEYRSTSAKELHVDVNTQDVKDKQAIDQFAARKLFHAFSGQTATGEVNLVDTPFAVCISGEKNDIDVLMSIDTRGVNGIYFDRKELETSTTSGLFSRSQTVKREVPLIAVVDSAFNELVPLEHEINHGVNQAIVQSLRSDTEKIWGSNKKSVDAMNRKNNAGNIVETVQQEYQNGNISREEFKQDIRHAMGLVLPDVMASAKDELIADFVSNEDFSFLSQLKIKPYQQSIHTGVHQYHYFSEIGFTPDKFGFNQESISIYDELAQEYNELIQDSVSNTQETWDLFRNFGMDKQKKGELTALLRQSPMSTWDKRIGFLYKEDRRELKPLLDKARQIDGAINNSSDKVNFINERSTRLNRQLSVIQEKGGKLDGNIASRVASLIASNEAINVRLTYLLDSYRDNTNDYATYDKDKVRSADLGTINRNMNPLSRQISELQADLGEITQPIQIEFNRLYDQS